MEKNGGRKSHETLPLGTVKDQQNFLTANMYWTTRGLNLVDPRMRVKRLYLLSHRGALFLVNPGMAHIYLNSYGNQTFTIVPFIFAFKARHSGVRTK